MTALDWVFVVCIGALAAIVLLTNRWGDFIGTHNWRVSRRLDRKNRKVGAR